MSKTILYIGLDVHAESINIATADAPRDGEIRSYGKSPTTCESWIPSCASWATPTRSCAFVMKRVPPVS